jgi:hypothetical protein
LCFFADTNFCRGLRHPTFASACCHEILRM